MQDSKCPECKQTIGGKDHITAPGNVKLDQKPNIQVPVSVIPGIYLEDPGSLSTHHSVRLVFLM